MGQNRTITHVASSSAPNWLASTGQFGFEHTAPSVFCLGHLYRKISALKKCRENTKTLNSIHGLHFLQGGSEGEESGRGVMVSPLLGAERIFCSHAEHV